MIKEAGRNIGFITATGLPLAKAFPKGKSNSFWSRLLTAIKYAGEVKEATKNRTSSMGFNAHLGLPKVKKF